MNPDISDETILHRTDAWLIDYKVQLNNGPHFHLHNCKESRDEAARLLWELKDRLIKAKREVSSGT